jgi:hypothetical protein
MKVETKPAIPLEGTDFSHWAIVPQISREKYKIQRHNVWFFLELLS